LALAFRNKGYSKDYIRERMKIFCSHDKNLEERLNKAFGRKK